MADADPAVRLAALRLATHLPSPAAGAALLPSLADGDGDLRRQAMRALAALDTPVPGAVAALLAAARGLDRRSATPDDDESEALGEALEHAATAGDGPNLETALLQAQSATWQPILRGLLASQPGAARPLSPAVIDRLWPLVSSDDGRGETTADLLSAQPWTTDTARRIEPVLIRAFDAAGSAVRARLCPALAHAATTATRAHLLQAASNTAETTEVRAAAAWALRGSTDGAVRTGLKQLAEGAPPPVAANAHAALLATPAARDVATGVRLTDPADRAFQARRWLILSASGAPPVWARTGWRGDVRVLGLPPGPVAVTPAEPGLQLAPPPSASR